MGLNKLLGRVPKWSSLGLVLGGLLAGPAHALDLRVAISQGADHVEVGSSTPAAVLDQNGHLLGELPPLEPLIAAPAGVALSLGNWRAQRIWIEPQAGGDVWIGHHWYHGKTLLVLQAGGVTAVNYVDLEVYLASVLGGEMSGTWPLEALEAQAVASRTYALYQRQKHLSPLFDLGDSTEWQVYRGVASESPATLAAVAATRGEVLTYDGQLILAVFEAASGGHTENSENVWLRALPYLRGVPDFDQGSPDYRWHTTVSEAQLEEAVPGIGPVLSLTPAQTTPTGRAVTLRVQGVQGVKLVDAATLRQALNLRSTWFQATPAYAPEASLTPIAQPIPATFDISGRGYGHGLGMSQWGAYDLARAGYGYQQILAYYYQHTTLAQLAQP